MAQASPLASMAGAASLVCQGFAVSKTCNEAFISTCLLVLALLEIRAIPEWFAHLWT